MSFFLYHAYLPENHAHFVSEEQVMQEGIQFFTKSNNRYSNGGRVKFEKTESLKPFNTPDWVNFKEAIGVDISNRFSKSFCFPVFTNKILIFDGDISISIYDQAFYDDFKDFDEEALNFDTGESIEHWIRLYWDSMMTLQAYLLKRPYPKPEVLVFESIPKEIIRVCEEKS
ncbi:DNA polymerase III [Paenibacillus sp. 79R4]|uniref:DNA polymerase III n=1 Tax=Paenibacillus sp. 79R4 TaxID=2212847 RepID=UPI0015B9218D|nr:DNA polymerase III [Paenibacillus sp. 79R4]